MLITRQGENIVNIINKTLLVLGATLLMTGCAQEQVKQTQYTPSCHVPNHKQVDVAFQQARKTLENRQCHYQFDAVHGQLLVLSQGDPKPTNSEHFKDFYNWSVNQGIISKLQGKQLYTSYFNTSFGNVLPNDRNNCSLQNERQQLFNKLTHELQHKKIGLQAIKNDREAYFKAQQIHNDLVFLLGTVEIACSVEPA